MRGDAGANCSTELDAYADFLRPLGSEPDLSYIDVDAALTPGSIHELRLGLANTLSETRLHALACTKSRFYHIGTVNEYISHFSGEICSI